MEVSAKAGSSNFEITAEISADRIHQAVVVQQESDIPSVIPTFQPTEGDELQTTDAPTFQPTEGDEDQTSGIPTFQPTEGDEDQTSGIPTFQPTEGDEDQTSDIPTFQPIGGDEDQDSMQPSSGPTVNVLGSIHFSPTWKSRNQASFAFTVRNGTSIKLYVYGDSKAGGNMTLVDSTVNLYSYLTASTGNSIVKVVSTLGAYAVLWSDGSISAWGLPQHIAGWQTYELTSFADLVATDKAFAGLTRDNEVVCFGAASHGGVIPNSLQSVLSSGVAGIASASAGAFAAWKFDGTVYTWGNRYAGGGVSSDTNSALTAIVNVVGTEGAFVGIQSDGSFVTWGNCFYGGCFHTGEQNPVSHISLVVASPTVFLGYTTTSELLAWGSEDLGGNIPVDVQTAFAQQVTQIDFLLTNRWSVAAFVNGNTSVLCWGDDVGGGDCADIPYQLVASEKFISIAATEKAFAAVTSQGRVFAWGDAQTGGGIPSTLASELSADVVEVVGNKCAFAARKSNGKVVAWGFPSCGGSTSKIATLVAADVVQVLGGAVTAFLAILADGRVVGWGQELVIDAPGEQLPTVELTEDSYIEAF
eukprot:gene24651-29785_t